MDKFKIFKLLLVGNLLLSVPFVGFIFYLFYDSNMSVDLILLITMLGFFYWSYTVPFYKFYAIKKLNNKDEYFLWKKLSINSLLFWPDSFFLTKTEFWDERKQYDYDKQKERVFSA